MFFPSFLPLPFFFFWTRMYITINLCLSHYCTWVALRIHWEHWGHVLFHTSTDGEELFPEAVLNKLHIEASTTCNLDDLGDENLGFELMLAWDETLINVGSGGWVNVISFVARTWNIVYQEIDSGRQNSRLTPNIPTFDIHVLWCPLFHCEHYGVSLLWLIYRIWKSCVCVRACACFRYNQDPYRVEFEIIK